MNELRVKGIMRSVNGEAGVMNVNDAINQEWNINHARLL